MIQPQPAVRSDDLAKQFVQLCLRGRWDATALEAARTLGAHRSLNWDAVCEVAQAEGLAPLLYSILRDQCMIPRPVVQAMRNAYDQTAVRNTILFNELGRLLRQLAAEDIDVILLKGVALAEVVYGNAAVRPMIDLDVLVRRADVPAALRMLSALGYAPTNVETHAGSAVEYENEVMLYKRGLIGTNIEVHWSLFDSPHYQHALFMDWFWQTALPILFEDAPALVLGAEAQVLHLSGHLALHHSGTERLWLHDIAEVIVHYQTQLDWEQVLARAQAYDLVLPLQQILPQIAEAWGVPIPGRVLERLHTLRASSDEVRVFNWLTAAHRPVALRFWADLASMASWHQRLHFAWINLFPSPAYMQHRYRIPHPLLLPVYYPYRWLLGIRSALGRGHVSPSEATDQRS